MMNGGGLYLILLSMAVLWVRYLKGGGHLMEEYDQTEFTRRQKRRKIDEWGRPTGWNR